MIRTNIYSGILEVNVCHLMINISSGILKWGHFSDWPSCCFFTQGITFPEVERGTYQTRSSKKKMLKTSTPEKKAHCIRIRF